MKQGNTTIYVIIAAVALAAIGYYAIQRDNNINEPQNTATNNPTDVDTVEDEIEQDQNTQGDNQQEGVMVGGTLMTPDKNIIDNAMGSTEHTTAIAAIQAAGLVDTLKGAGPYTVFAPTNSAFDKLPQGTMEELVKPENRERLTSILDYHIVEGSYTTDTLTEGRQLTAMNGQTLTFNQRDGSWWINNSVRITTPDVRSSNGVIHVVDAVLMPGE